MKTFLTYITRKFGSVLEYGAVIFHNGLTKKQSNAIEAVQRKVLFLLSSYINVKFSYSEATFFFVMEQLQSRRLDLCKTFVKRYLKNPRFPQLFEVADVPYKLRQTNVVKEIHARKGRFYSSPLLFLRRLANQMTSSK